MELLGYPRLPTWFSMVIFFRNLRLMEFWVRYLALFCLFLVVNSFKWFWMGSLHNNIQLILEFISATLFLLYISNDLSDVIYNVAIYADDTTLYCNTLYCKCDQESDMWQQLEMTSELSMLAEKLHLFCLTGLITLVLLT